MNGTNATMSPTAETLAPTIADNATMYPTPAPTITENATLGPTITFSPTFNGTRAPTLNGTFSPEDADIVKDGAITLFAAFMLVIGIMFLICRVAGRRFKGSNVRSTEEEPLKETGDGYSREEYMIGHQIELT